jgi:hypothetical protein
MKCNSIESCRSKYLLFLTVPNVICLRYCSTDSIKASFVHDEGLNEYAQARREISMRLRSAAKLCLKVCVKLRENLRESLREILRESAGKSA